MAMSKNAYWYGSRLSLEETRRLAPYQNATGLAGDIRGAGGHGLGARKPATPASSRRMRSTTSAASKCRSPYLGPVEGHYTDWTPLDGRPGLFPEDIDEERSVAVPQCTGALTPR
jgi:homospermidine synthase